MKKLIVLVVLFVALAATAGAYPQKPVLGWDQTEWGWSDSEGVSRPVAVDASGTVQVSIVGGVTITIGSTTFTFSPVFSDSLGSGTLGLTDSGRRIVVNIGSETIGLLQYLASLSLQISSTTAAINATPAVSLATGTHEIGEVGPDAASVGSGTPTAPTRPFAVQLYGSDGVNIQAILTGIAQANGVNGNNSLCIVPYAWNGATFDRQVTKPTTASQSIVLLSSADFVVVPFANRQYVSLSATGTFEYVIGAAAVPANTAPCYNASFEGTASVSVAVKTTATPTYLTIRHWGN